jgi:hypothetical protein
MGAGCVDHVFKTLCYELDVHHGHYVDRWHRASEAIAYRHAASINLLGNSHAMACVNSNASHHDHTM